MACNSTNCQSGCYKDSSLHGAEKDQLCQPVVTDKAGLQNGAALRGSNSSSLLCVKCKVNQTMGASKTELSVNGADVSRFCADCFRSNLYGKFRLAVTSNALISPSDNVLVAFSGGPSSRVALQFVHEMQVKAQNNFDASRDKALPVFGVGVALVDESVAFVAREFDNTIEEMKLVVSNLAPPIKHLHVISLESVYSSNSPDGSKNLKELLNSVCDVSGREDLVKHLKFLSLQKFAMENGYTKIVLGTCTSRIACHVLEATVKGRGYSLAADIQYVDARWEIPMVLPLRDCLAEELNLLCRLDSLKTLEVFHYPCSGINGLVASFVKILQEDNPSRESTIVRTAGKLTPFHFNKMPEPDDSNGQLASQRRKKKYNLNMTDSLPPESFCSICYSPLSKSDFRSHSELGNGDMSAGSIRNASCSSCQFQILPEEASALEKLCDLLPTPMIARIPNIRNSNLICLREQIQDCLLSDPEDGS